MNPQKNRKGERGKGRSVHISKTAALLALFCVCIGGISMVGAKYIQKKEKSQVVTAYEFYFESDLLDGRTHEVVPSEDSENGKTASVTIRLKNHVDDLRYSDTKIEYAVAVTDETDSSTEISVDKGKGEITGGACNDVDVTLTNLQAGHTYVVTATTSNYYQKTLTGTIKVIQPDTQIYASISDKTQYVEVTVWTIDYTGTVTLNYADSLIPDNTDAKMESAQSGDMIRDDSWGANTSHVFRFFKQDTSKKYQVSVNGGEVTVSETQQ